MDLNELLREVVDRKGSDLHLVPGYIPTMRIDGKLARISSVQIVDSDEMMTLFAPFLTETQKSALQVKQDVHTSIVAARNSGSERNGEPARFRIALFWELGGLCASLRAIPFKIPLLSDLFTPETEATFRGLIDRRHGLILVVGPTGSGKSTTTASLINLINIERDERIITIEDPIEYIHSSKVSLISQREVGTDVESFEQGGLTALRSDPDVVLVSELQTPEAVRIAIALAETGHLVFATMHADSVSEAIRRMVESFPDARDTMRRMIARSLIAAISQRLTRRADRPGRVPLHEIMIVNSRIRRLIESGETDFQLAIEAGRNEGMCTVDDCAVQLYRGGVLTYESAWDIALDRDRLGPPPRMAEDAGIASL